MWWPTTDRPANIEVRGGERLFQAALLMVVVVAVGDGRVWLAGLVEFMRLEMDSGVAWTELTTTICVQHVSIKTCLVT